MAFQFLIRHNKSALLKSNYITKKLFCNIQPSTKQTTCNFFAIIAFSFENPSLKHS